MSKMRDDELVSIIRSYRDTALGYDDSDLSNERATAMDHYHGRKYGNEKEGESQVVSKDLAEAVNDAMPVILNIFLKSGQLVEFDAVGDEDEALAEQETDYVNHVIMKDNVGYMLMHDWLKDVLLLKNGYVKHWWDDSEKITETSYEGLTEDELVQLFSELQQDGAEVEVKEQDEQFIVLPDGSGVPVYDIELRIKRKVNRVKIEAVPVEEIRIAKESRGSTQDSRFVEHNTRKTRSELVEMGMPKDWVYRLPAYNEETNDELTRARDSIADESEDYIGSTSDRSMDDIDYCEAYIRVDYDGDGIAELRKVVTCADKIPPGGEWNEPIDACPITGAVIKRVPHRHIGESLDDEVSDIQEIKTTLWRQMLSNIYRTNNQQWLVNERVHLPDFMQSLPGGVKRVKDDQPVSGCAEPIQTTPILQQILPAIDYTDQVKEGRTGINKAITGMDPDVLKQTNNAVYLENLSRESNKIEMYARMFAESGVRELALRVHELLLKHQDKARIVKLRGKYVPVNPQEWRERTDLTVKVGLGTGTNDEKRQRLMLAADGMARLDEYGLVGPQHAYRMFGDILRTMGWDNPEKYAFDPASPEYKQMMQQRQQGQTNPLAEAEQVKGQMQLQLNQAKQDYDGQVKLLQAQFDAQMEQYKQSVQANDKERDRQSREAIEAAKLEVQAFLEGARIDIGKPGMGAGLQE